MKTGSVRQLADMRAEPRQGKAALYWMCLTRLLPVQEAAGWAAYWGKAKSQAR